MELEEEKRVEATLSSALIQSDNFNPNEIISGHISALDESWSPITGFAPAGFTTSKPFPVSELHTNIALKSPSPSKYNSYEVTEYSPEESVNNPTTFKSKPPQTTAAGTRDYQGYFFRPHTKRHNDSSKNKTTATSKIKFPEPTAFASEAFVLKKATVMPKTRNVTSVADIYSQIQNSKAVKSEVSQSTKGYQKLTDSSKRVKKNNDGRGTVKFGEKV